MRLYIDTSSNKHVLVKLGDKQLVKAQTIPNSQVVLKLIDQILKQNQAKLTDLTVISVNQGPGSFTGLRVGTAVANALRYALNLGKPLEPEYGEPPHIATPQKH